MTPDDHGPTDRLGPNPPGDVPVDDVTRLEANLRGALDGEAQRIAPSERLGAILAAAHRADGSRRAEPPRSRWAIAAAAAAAALAVVGGMVWLTGRPGGQTTPTGTTAATGIVTSTATGTSVGPTPPASTSGPVPSSGATGAPAPTDTSAVPVYYAGPRLLHGPALGLFREFVPSTGSGPAGPEEKAQAALTVAVGTPPADAAYEQLWSGVRVLGVTVAADRITVELSGRSPVSADRATVAVQQLVWTAQAAVGRGNLPVHFVLADASPTLAGTLPASQDYRRPTDELEVSSLIAPLWIDNPSRGQVVPAGSAITVTGQASTFEATVVWQLLRGSDVLQKGSTMASIGAPSRGQFSFALSGVPAGSYTIRVFEVSMKDGSDFAEQRIPFSVR